MRPISRFDSGPWALCGRAGARPSFIRSEDGFDSHARDLHSSIFDVPWSNGEGRPAYIRETGVRFPRG